MKMYTTLMLLFSLSPSIFSYFILSIIKFPFLCFNLIEIHPGHFIAKHSSNFLTLIKSNRLSLVDSFLFSIYFLFVCFFKKYTNMGYKQI